MHDRLSPPLAKIKKVVHIRDFNVLKTFGGINKIVREVRRVSRSCQNMALEQRR